MQSSTSDGMISNNVSFKGQLNGTYVFEPFKEILLILYWYIHAENSLKKQKQKKKTQCCKIIPFSLKILMRLEFRFFHLWNNSGVYFIVKPTFTSKVCTFVLCSRKARKLIRERTNPKSKRFSSGNFLPCDTRILSYDLTALDFWNITFRHEGIAIHNLHIWEWWLFFQTTSSFS